MCLPRWPHCRRAADSPSLEQGWSQSAGSWAQPGFLPSALLICRLAMDMNNSSREGSTEDSKPEASGLLPTSELGVYSSLLNGLLVEALLDLRFHLQPPGQAQERPPRFGVAKNLA